MIDWRPIETAPTIVQSGEDKPFLAWHRAGFPVVLAWVVTGAGPTLLDAHSEVVLNDFTHWAPLTPPEGK